MILHEMLKHLNVDGNELIYEEPGDDQRGNPLDIVTIAAVHRARTVTGRKFNEADRQQALALFAASAELYESLKEVTAKLASFCALFPGRKTATDDDALERAYAALERADRAEKPKEEGP